VLAGHERFGERRDACCPTAAARCRGSDDRTLRLWDLEGGAEPRVLAGHEEWVNGVLLLTDGRRALSWSDDRTLRLWNLEDAAEPRVLGGHENSVNGALLLPDGRRTLSWSGDGDAPTMGLRGRRRAAGVRRT
jgi:WD40 repeat protein